MIGVEIRKLVRRPRTWVSVALLCLLPTVVAVFLALSGIAPRPGEGPAFLSAVLSNGQLYPAAALGIVLPIFLPVSVAVVAGDSIAGEASTGTLRYLLARAVGRTRLLVAKLAAVIVYTLVAVQSSLAAGASVVCGQVTVPAFGSFTPTLLRVRTPVFVTVKVYWMVSPASVNPSPFTSTGGLACLSIEMAAHAAVGTKSNAAWPEDVPAGASVTPLSPVVTALAVFVTVVPGCGQVFSTVVL